MKFTVYDNLTGEILRWGVCDDQDLELQANRERECAVEGEFRAQEYFWDGEAMAAKPPRPSPSHVFDYTQGAWVADLSAARERRLADIEAERDRRLVAPVIRYDGKNLDARERDIRNLERKLAEVRSRIDAGQPLPAGQLFWRDADNELHVFADMPTYKAWLDGFAIALGSRGTDAWAWSWQKKAQVAAAQTLADLDAIDLTG